MRYDRLTAYHCYSKTRVPQSIIVNNTPKLQAKEKDESNDPLKKYWVMFKPTKDWMTRPLSVAGEGNAKMLQAVQDGTMQAPNAGAQVIEALAGLYRAKGRRVLLFESSQALHRTTTDILGHPDPDDVFTVDYISGHRLKNGEYINILNTLSATPRMLEHYVAERALRELGVINTTTQIKGIDVEGGDFTFIPEAIPKMEQGNESILVMGEGPNSRTNDEGRKWLRELFSPDHILTVRTDQFHRDLVSTFLLDKEGRLVQVLLAQAQINNRDQLNEQLRQLGVGTVDIPEHLATACALNVSVNKGDIIGMQSFGAFEATLKDRLSPNVTYHVLPEHLQDATRGFTILQGGANCVSGSIVADPEDIDDTPKNIQRINDMLNGRDFEDELRAYATDLDLFQKVQDLKEKQSLNRRIS